MERPPGACAPGTALNTLPESGYLILSATLQITPFTDEETESQRRAGTCPRPTTCEGWSATRVFVQPRLQGRVLPEASWLEGAGYE